MSTPSWPRRSSPATAWSSSRRPAICCTCRGESTPSVDAAVGAAADAFAALAASPTIRSSAFFDRFAARLADDDVFAADRRRQRGRRRSGAARGAARRPGLQLTAAMRAGHGRRAAQLAATPDCGAISCWRRVEHDGWSVESWRGSAGRRRLRVRGPAERVRRRHRCAAYRQHRRVPHRQRRTGHGAGDRAPRARARRCAEAGLPEGAVQLVDVGRRTPPGGRCSPTGAWRSRSPAARGRPSPSSARSPASRRPGQPARHGRRVARAPRPTPTPDALRRQPSSTRSTARCATRSTSAACRRLHAANFAAVAVAAADRAAAKRGADSGGSSGGSGRLRPVGPRVGVGERTRVLAGRGRHIGGCGRAVQPLSPRLAASLISEDQQEQDVVLLRRRRSVRRQRVHPMGRRAVCSRPTGARPVELAVRPAVRPQWRVVGRFGLHGALACGGPRPLVAPLTVSYRRASQDGWLGARRAEPCCRLCKRSGSGGDGGAGRHQSRRKRRRRPRRRPPRPTRPPSPQPSVGTQPTTDATTTSSAPAAADPNGIGDPLFPALGNPGSTCSTTSWRCSTTRPASRSRPPCTSTSTSRRTGRRSRSTRKVPSFPPSRVDGAAATFEAAAPELIITPAAPLTSGQPIARRHRLHDRQSATGAVGVHRFGRLVRHPRRFLRPQRAGRCPNVAAVQRPPQRQGVVPIRVDRPHRCDRRCQRLDARSHIDTSDGHLDLARRPADGDIHHPTADR